MDDDILKTVESILGKNVKIVDCEKTSSIREEEILLINGIPVQLDGEDGNAIKKALISGQVPSCDLLNQLLYQAGILSNAVHLESTVSVKSSLVTKEDVIVAKDGQILDERCHETSEDQYYSSICDELWQPVAPAQAAIANDIKIDQHHCTLEIRPHQSNLALKVPLQRQQSNHGAEPNSENFSAKSPKYNANPVNTTASQESATPYNKYINQTPFRNIKREQIDSIITTSSVTDKVRIPITDKAEISQQLSQNSTDSSNRKRSTIASIKSKPKIELSSSTASATTAVTAASTTTPSSSASSSSSSSVFPNMNNDIGDANYIDADFIDGRKTATTATLKAIGDLDEYNSYDGSSRQFFGLNNRLPTNATNCGETSSSISNAICNDNINEFNRLFDDKQTPRLQHNKINSITVNATAKNPQLPVDCQNEVYFNRITSYTNTKKQMSRNSFDINCPVAANRLQSTTTSASSLASGIKNNEIKFKMNDNNIASLIKSAISDDNSSSSILPSITKTATTSSSSSNFVDSGHDDEISYNSCISTLSQQQQQEDDNFKLKKKYVSDKSIQSNRSVSSDYDETDCYPHFHPQQHRNQMNTMTQNISNLEIFSKSLKICSENNSTDCQQQQQQQKHTTSSATTTTTVIDENFLVYRDGLLISGPIDSLIKHMVPTSNYYPEHSFVFAFLLSARLFINPYELLERICQLCEEQQNIIVKSQTVSALSKSASNATEGKQYSETISTEQISGPTTVSQQISNDSSINSKEAMTAHAGANQRQNDTKKILKMFAKNFLRLLSEWVDLFPYDFRDERLMQQVRTMQQKCIRIDNNLRQDVSIILQNLLEKLTVLEKYENFLQYIAASDVIDCSNVNSLELECSSNNSIKHANEKEHHLSLSTSANNHHWNPTTTSSSSLSFHHHITGLLPLYTNHSMSSSSIGSTTSIGGVEMLEICPSSTMLSQQLTHIELERLSHIGPEEFVQVFAKENVNLIEQQKSSSSLSSTGVGNAGVSCSTDLKKTRNLETYVHWFNRLSYLVATEIVKYPKKKQRVRVVEYWIETARECFNIGNFNSLMAIIAGLNMSPISRLKKTWAKVQSAKFSVLEHQMDPSSNFNSYRSTLKAAMWRSAGATNERERIIVPFFSLLVKDLYFLNEGCSNRLANGHINFDKFWQVSKQIKEFITWKEVTCPFDKNSKTIMYLQTNPILNENTLAIASFECEPPENQLEKERFKSLKNEILQGTTNSGFNSGSSSTVASSTNNHHTTNSTIQNYKN